MREGCSYKYPPMSTANYSYSWCRVKFDCLNVFRVHNDFTYIYLSVAVAMLTIVTPVIKRYNAHRI